MAGLPGLQPGYGQGTDVNQLERTLRASLAEVLRDRGEGVELSSLRQEMKQEFLALSGETKQDIRGLHQEVHGLTRWSIGVIIAVVVGLGGVIASMLAILARLP